MPNPTDPRAVAAQPALGYDPDCPECKGTGQRDSGGIHPWGEPAMMMCDCDAPPHPVADDPSGIVQQMPEGDLAELRASIPAGPWTAHRSHPLHACTYVCAGEWNREVATLYGCFDDVKQPDEGQPWPNHPIREATARAIALLPDLLDEVITRRATEADLRAEIERLRGLLWYAWSEFNAIRARSGAPLSNDGIPLVAEDWWNTMTDAFGEAIGDDAQTPWPSPEARAALSPETDGGRPHD